MTKVNTSCTVQTINTDIDLNVFDESEWDFLQVDNETKNYEYFKDVEDFYIQTPRKHLLSMLIYGIACGVVGLSLVLGTCYLYYYYVKDNISSQSQVEAAVSNLDSQIERVSGIEVETADLIGISTTLTNYFNVYSTKQNLSELNNYCIDSSSFYLFEESYRDATEAIYDKNDCYARLLKDFSKFITANRINSVILKDGVYYVYITLTVPDDFELYQYYNSYKYAMTRYFSNHILNYENVAKYLLDINSAGKLPLKSKEYMLKVTKIDDSYYIVDDSQISSICVDSITTSVADIVNILGGTLVNK